MGQYVDRGDHDANDFEVGSFSTDPGWHDLNLSGIVPAGAIAVHISVAVSGPQSGWTTWFRENGNVNSSNSARIITQVAGIAIFQDMIVVLDSNRIIEYRTVEYMTEIDFNVRGWFL